MPLLYLDRKDFMSFMKKQATELAQIETQITQIKRQNKKAKILLPKQLPSLRI